VHIDLNADVGESTTPLEELVELALLDAGLCSLSVAPATVARVKSAIARHRAGTSGKEPIA